MYDKIHYKLKKKNRLEIIRPLFQASRVIENIFSNGNKVGELLSGSWKFLDTCEVVEVLSESFFEGDYLRPLCD